MTRIMVAVGYTFAAWLVSGFFVFAGYRYFGRALQIAFHCGGVLLCFIPVFILYFTRSDSLPPLLTAALALSFIVLLDILIVGPYFVRRMDFFLSFWDWQLPALLVAGSIYATGRLVR